MKQHNYTALGVMLLATLALTFLLTDMTYAQGAGDTDRDRTQERDQIRDPETYDGTEPDVTRERDQDRDRLQTATDTATTADDTYENKEKTQYRGGDDTETPDDPTRIRTQERAEVHATSSEHLRLLIREREQEMLRTATTGDGAAQEQVRNENRVRTAVHALLAAEDLIGPMGQQVRLVAHTMGTEHDRAVEEEGAINGRGFFARFFFGGDREHAGELAEIATTLRARIEELRELLDDQAVPAEVRAELQTQLENALRELDRIETRANEELTRWGLFSWRF
jgi:hypothetical protein